MTESEKNLVIRLWDSGATIGEIVKLLPYKEYIAKEYIREMKSQGILVGRSGKSQAKTLAKAINLYNSGITNVCEIAELLGMKKRSVETIFRKGNFKRPRPKHNYRETNICDKSRAILDDIRQGEMSLSEIARKHNVNRQWVWQLKNKNYKQYNEAQREIEIMDSYAEVVEWYDL